MENHHDKNSNDGLYMYLFRFYISYSEILTLKYLFIILGSIRFISLREKWNSASVLDLLGIGYHIDCSFAYFVKPGFGYQLCSTKNFPGCTTYNLLELVPCLIYRFIMILSPCFPFRTL